MSLLKSHCNTQTWYQKKEEKKERNLSLTFLFHIVLSTLNVSFSICLNLMICISSFLLSYIFLYVCFFFLPKSDIRVRFVG